jgi:hypothetical protein
MLTVVTWTVALSVYAHGLTAWPGANRYADWYTAHSADHPSMPESVPATEQRIRAPALPSGRRGPGMRPQVIEAKFTHLGLRPDPAVGTLFGGGASAHGESGLAGQWDARGQAASSAPATRSRRCGDFVSHCRR